MSTINIIAEEDSVQKRLWNDKNTKWLLDEFKKYYEEWKNGRISKKRQMWIKISGALISKGCIATPDQVENRFKTLQRSYRKSCGFISPRKTSRDIQYKSYKNELSNIFLETLPMMENEEDEEQILDQDDDSIIMENSVEHVEDREEEEEEEEEEGTQYLDPETGSIFTLAPQISSELLSLPRSRPTSKENVKSILFQMLSKTDNKITEIQENSNETQLYSIQSTQPTKLPTQKKNITTRIDNLINKNEQILNQNTTTSSKYNKRNLSKNYVKNILTKKIKLQSVENVKTSVDVLLEIKELIKKVEIRRQARHEQNIKLATERNALLHKKNELLEKLLLKSNL